MGYQSHLSLFFVIMRGECDPLLKWPFEYKVSMILVGKFTIQHFAVGIFFFIRLAMTVFTGATFSVKSYCTIEYQIPK